MENLSPDDLDDYLDELFNEVAADIIASYVDPSRPQDEWKLSGLARELAAFGRIAEAELDAKNVDELKEVVVAHFHKALARQKQKLGKQFPLIARYLILRTIDEAWLAHLYTLDDLKEGIGWTAYAGTDPLVAFKRESYVLFQEMLSRAADKIVRSLLSPRLTAPGENVQSAPAQNVNYVHAGASSTSSTAPKKPKKKPVVKIKKVGRNDPCPCGSGKKYKNCCGKNA